MASRAPLGWIGGLGGGIGALPIVSAARHLATLVVPGPRLPGAERLAGDLKAATFAEAGVFLLVIPLFALLFGGLLPRRLERHAAIDGLSFEWIGGVFSLAFPVWRSGIPAQWALAAGFAAALGFAAFLVHFRRRPPRTRRWTAPGAETIGRLAATAAAWELARRASSGGFDPDFAPLCVVALLAAIPFFVQTFSHHARSGA